MIYHKYLSLILFLGSGCFAINNILPLEAILPSPFMCLLIAIVTTVLEVTLWHVDNAGVLKCNGYGLESLLEGHLDKVGVHWREAWYVNVQDSVRWGCKIFNMAVAISPSMAICPWNLFCRDHSRVFI